MTLRSAACWRCRSALYRNALAQQRCVDGGQDLVTLQPDMHFLAQDPLRHDHLFMHRDDEEVAFLPDWQWRLHRLVDGNAADIDGFAIVNASSEVKNGVWKLRVSDLFRGDTGFVDSWSLTV